MEEDLNCCQKCRSVSRRMCGRIKSFFNKTKQTQDLNEKSKGKKSIVTLFRNKHMKSRKKSVTDDADRYSLMGFGNKWSMKSIMDLRERSLFQNIKSKFNLSKGNLSNLSATVLKKKYSITKSKEATLNNMLKDYKKGRLDLKDLNKGSKLDFENLDKNKLNKILRDYENKQRTNEIYELFKISAADLKKKFSITGSEQVVLKRMKADFTKNRLSLSFLKDLSKLDLKKMDKEKFRKVIKNYEAKHKKRNIEFATDSKLEQVRSFVKSRFLHQY